MTSPQSLPYVDYLLALLKLGNGTVEQYFGRHLHFGYWPETHPQSAASSDFAQATDRLSLELGEAAGIAPGARVLDVGCGFGGTIAVLNEHYRGVHLIGLDLDGRALERAAAITGAHPGNLIEWRQGDGCALPFEDNSFDRVVAIEAVHHFSSRARFLHEVYRVLRPGGRIAMTDFVPATPFLQVAKSVTESPKGVLTRHLGRCDLSCSIYGYRELLKSIGFLPLVERNITGDVHPTYRSLEALIGAGSGVEDKKASIAPVLDMLRLASAVRLLNYYLLAFGKTYDGVRSFTFTRPRSK